SSRRLRATWFPSSRCSGAPTHRRWWYGERETCSSTSSGPTGSATPSPARARSSSSRAPSSSSPRSAPSRWQRSSGSTGSRSITRRLARRPRGKRPATCDPRHRVILPPPISIGGGDAGETRAGALPDRHDGAVRPSGTVELHEGLPAPAIAPAGGGGVRDPPHGFRVEPPLRITSRRRARRIRLRPVDAQALGAPAVDGLRVL